MSRIELLGLGFLLVTSTACGPGRLSAEGEEGTGETVVPTSGEGEGEVGGWEFEGEVDDDDWGEDRLGVRGLVLQRRRARWRLRDRCRLHAGAVVLDRPGPSRWSS